MAPMDDASSTTGESTDMLLPGRPLLHMFLHRLALTLLVAATLTVSSTGAANAALVSGLQDGLVTTVSQPAVITFAPDGRLFIGEKASGQIRIYKAGALL